MATANELMGRNTAAGKVTRVWVAENATDESDALATVIAAAPSDITYDGKTLPARKDQATVRDLKDNYECEGYYKVTIPYELSSAKQQEIEAEDALENDTSDVYSFSVGGVATHVEVGTFIRKVGDVPPAQEGVIGYANGTVNGIDIPANSGLPFQITHRFQPGTLPAGYVYTLANLVNKTNDAVFKGIGIGECLFLGAQASNFVLGGVVEITYDFAISRDATVTLPGTLGSILKEGWNYLDMLYAERADAGVLIHEPTGAQVIQVHEQADYTDFGI